MEGRIELIDKYFNLRSWEEKLDWRVYCAFHKHANCKGSEAVFTIGFFAAVNYNYDHKQPTLKHRYTVS